jgi:hypothetical protein
VKPVERVGYFRGAVALADVAIRERDVEVLVNRQIVEQVILLEDEADLLVAQRAAILRLQAVDGFVSKKYSPLQA